MKVIQKVVKNTSSKEKHITLTVDSTTVELRDTHKIIKSIFIWADTE